MYTKLLPVTVLLWLASPVWADDDVAEFTLDEVEMAEVELADDRPRRGAAGKLPATRSDAIHAELGELRWGMSKQEVLGVLKERIRLEYEPRIRKSLDAVKQDALIQRANEAYRRIKRNFVSFDGRVTGWDVSPVAPEFRHGTREAMLVVGGEGSRDFYFFINNRLWKLYRELDTDTFGGMDYETVMGTFQRRFGRGEGGYGERAEGAPPQRWIEWNVDGTKATALERGAQYCLIFEDTRTLQQMALLRKNALPRGKKHKSTIDAILMDDGERAALHEEVDRRLSSGSTRR